MNFQVLISYLDHDDEYTYLENKSCSGGYFESHSSYHAATVACAAYGRDCRCVVDDGCTGQWYYLDKGTPVDSLLGSCAWIKGDLTVFFYLKKCGIFNKVAKWSPSKKP